MKKFTISKINQDKKNSNSMVEHLSDPVFKKHSKIIVQSFKKFEEIKLPKTNETLHLISLRNLNAVGAINYISTLEKINELTIVVYSINEPSALRIIDIAKELNIKADIIVSTIRNTAAYKKENAIKHFEQNPELINLTYLGSHAKIILIKTDVSYYSIETSANLSPNSRIEQYVINNHEQLYLFHKNWIEKAKQSIND